MEYANNLLKNKKIVFLTLTILVFIVYVNSLGNNFVVDDITSIVEKSQTESFKSLANKDLRSTQLVQYFTVINIFGPNSSVFRLANILFHLGSVYLVFLLLSILTTSTIAFVTASLFAVHPILTESVTWISGGPYVKHSFFILASLLCYVLSIKKRNVYLLSVLFFFLALFTSEKAIVFPFILMVYEIAFGSIQRHWKKIIPFFFLAFFFFFLVAFPALDSRLLEIQTKYDRKPIINNSLILIPYSISSYLELIIWPDKLSIYHSQIKISVLDYILRLSIFIGFLAAIAIAFKKNKHLFFWLFFFLISLSPTLSPFGINWIVAERYVYLGSLGIIFLAGYLLVKLIEKEKARNLGWALFIIIMIALMARTMVRNTDWKNSETLWLATVNSYPNYYQGHYSLGVEYEETGRLKEAQREYEIAIRLNSQEPRAYANLGSVYLKTNNTSKALEMSEKAVKLNPWAWEPYQNIGVIYYIRGAYDKAEAYTKKAIERLPKNSDRYIKASSELYFNLGATYYQEGDRVKARKFFTKVLEFEPTNERTQKLLHDSALWSQ